MHSQDEHPLRTGDNDNVSNTREHLSASLLGSQSDGHSVEEHKSSTHLTDEEQTQAVLPVDESEVYFLIADFLTRHSVCHKAANALIQELAEHQLLKSSVDWTGTSRTATYEDYRLRHRDLSSSHLVELLQEATTFSRLDGKNDGDKKKKKTKKMKDVHTSLLLKTRVRRQLILSLDESKQLAKDIVKQLFRLREVLKTVKVVEKVIKKYERYQKYTTLTSVEELPLELQLAMVDNDTGIKTDTKTK
ncbi:hypothetical protein DD238_004255 [Peronospora effusa]|uniref:BRWD/PHIP N-terminal domain-containing protein n=1 Tax=Peronospora effusa TaxID=542832 RepID=A0A3M6VQX5_9STRA|nr:hypothetical protein DD238_004255 [Peronospora effusa]